MKCPLWGWGLAWGHRCGVTHASCACRWHGPHPLHRAGHCSHTANSCQLGVTGLFRAEWDLPTKLISKAFPLSHTAQKEPPCSPSCSGRSLGEAGSNPSPRLSQQFMSRDYTGLIEPLHDFIHRIKDGTSNIFI